MVLVESDDGTTFEPAMYRYQKRPLHSPTSNRIGLSDRKFDVAENGLSRSEMKTSKNESSSGITKKQECPIGFGKQISPNGRPTIARKVRSKTP